MSTEVCWLILTKRTLYGVSLEESSQAIAGLNSQVSMFNQMSSQQQKSLATTSARLSAVGVSGEMAGKGFDTMLNGLNMSVEAANETQLELIALGDAIGVPADVILTEFNGAAGELAKYGKDMVGVFKNLQGAAEATGVSFDSLMSITSQFDTFEGAATSAGKLNAILGGGVINSMDLLNATEEERVRLLIQSIQASGKSFENMNRFERQAIANAAGIQDMAEANKIFSQSLSAYDEQIAKAGGLQQNGQNWKKILGSSIGSRETSRGGRRSLCYSTKPSHNRNRNNSRRLTVPKRYDFWLPVPAITIE